MLKAEDADRMLRFLVFKHTTKAQQKENNINLDDPTLTPSDKIVLATLAINEVNDHKDSETFIDIFKRFNAKREEQKKSGGEATKAEEGDEPGQEAAKKKKKAKSKKKEEAQLKQAVDTIVYELSNHQQKLTYNCPKPKWCLDHKIMPECKPFTKRFKLDLVSLDAFSEFLE